ncbi:MAG: Gfo/Idh/MocA family oxidoreductase [Defluviitaleaceae bacterium]|nr:Gfo/Idh/MocA family oxidoreductase [Defluviitaleaceae bacterium]MCL2836861.1 Gfo/Idh/MocA family oxidoreductase [Defluviitaleaceae bacterium]
MRIALIGAGERGFVYSQYAHGILGFEIAAVADPIESRRELARERFNIPASMSFKEGGELIAASPQIDALIIASQDKDHYAHTMAAIEKGWDILLEKPISPDARECLAISEKAKATSSNVTVCHVLRYTPFFTKLKEIVSSRVLGPIVAINHTENIGNFHMAHSFVRGNWRNSAESSPIIMQKSCHDLDILLWLTGSGAKRISSFGGLSYFKESNAPEGSADRCLDCAAAEHCRFDVRKAYFPVMGSWPARVLTPDQTAEGLLQAFRDGPYGRCVFKCDNNVCDHQSTAIEFENNVTATFTLSGMTNRICRAIHIMCEDGEIYGDDGKGEIIITKFRSNNADGYERQIIHIGSVSGGHGGGDEALMNDFAAGIGKKEAGESRSSIHKSVESHLMACAAEESRLTNRTVCMSEFKERLASQK